MAECGQHSVIVKAPIIVLGGVIKTTQALPEVIEGDRAVHAYSRADRLLNCGAAALTQSKRSD